MKILFYLLFCLFFFVKAAHTQKLPVAVFSPKNGSLFSGANSIYQDNEGWMWFTSTYDVIRYDGHQFKTYPPSTGTKKNFCYKILEVGKEIWVLADPFTMKVAGDSLVELQIKNLPEIRSHLSWKQQDLFIARDGLYEFNKGVFTPLIRDDSLAINTDENLYALNDTLVVTYAWSKKLIVFDLKNKKIHSLDYPVFDIKKDKTGKLFMLLKGKGIYAIHPGLLNNIAGDEDPYLAIPDSRADQFVIDAENNFWVAIQDHYLLKTSIGNTPVLYNESDGLPSLWFHDMYRDREGNIWIGFNSGLCKIKDSHWKRYTLSQGLYSNHIYYFAKAADGSQAYVITRSGVNMIAGNKILPVKTSQGTAFTCTHLFAEEQRLFYLRDSALYTAAIDTINWKLGPEKKLTTLPAKALYLSKDKNGALFIASDKGLFSWYNNKIENILRDQEHYHTVLADSRGRLWAARFWGELLCFSIRYDQHSLSLKQFPTGARSVKSMKALQKPRALVEDSQGNVYVGTRYDGLFYLATTGDSIHLVQRWTEADQLKSNSVWGLATGPSGDCWIATAKGINRISKTTAGSNVTDEGTVAQLYQGSSVFISNEERVWIASHPGIVLLDKRKKVATPFSTFITGFFVNGKVIQAKERDPGPAQKFGYRQNNISIDFSANTFLDEEEVRYSYRLLRNGKGEWATASFLHSVNYPALLPGTYSFEVQSANSSGTASNNIATLSFKILPPFWQRSWFIILLILTALAIVWLLYRYRIRQLMKLQEMRNSISRNLHDDIGASLTNINILNTLAMRNLSDQQKAGHWLQKAGEDIQQISESLSDIVWNINPLNDNLDNLLRHMKRYAADMLEGKDIAASLDFPLQGSRINLSMEKRNDFFLIFKEAVNNLVKYSKAPAARILVEQQNGTIRMLIEDNGVGFDPVIANAGNGLKNMKQRAVNLHAALKIESRKGKGTAVELKMKI